MSYAGRGRTRHRVRRIGALDDLAGGGQIVVDGGFAYVGHMKPPHGTTILDVRDPSRPKRVAEIRLPDDASHTHKLRVVGDTMIVNIEQNQRHFKRKAAALPDHEAKLAAGLGRPPTDAEIARRLEVAEEDIGRMRAVLREPAYRDGGFRIYDISDRASPQLLSDTKTFGFGVHRFDADARYAYISTEMEGYVGNILVVYDIGHPRRPEEVSRWWMPGQHLAGGETPAWSGYGHRLHHAMRVGDELWAAVWHAGIRVIDCADISSLKTVGSYRFPAAIPEPTHTVMPFRDRVGGRRYACAIDEEHEHVHGRLHGFMWFLDVTDLGAIEPVAAFDVSELDSPYARTGGRFGAHQYHEGLDGPLVYATWFAGGLRIVDASDPRDPREVGHFIPEPRGGAPSPQSNDVAVDERGLIYLIDRLQGLDILEFEGL